MPKKKTHKKRRKNPAAAIAKVPAASRAVSIPVATLLRSMNPARRHSKKGKRRYRNPGIPGGLKTVFSRDNITRMGKGAIGGVIGLLVQSKGLDRIGVTGPAKGLTGIVAALVASKVIPDRDIATGAQVAISMRILQNVLISQGITFFSGRSGRGLTAEQVQALTRATGTMGAAIPRGAGDLMGEAMRRSPSPVLGEAMRRPAGPVLGEAMRRTAFNPSRTLDMLGMSGGRYEAIEL